MTVNGRYGPDMGEPTSEDRTAAANVRHGEVALGGELAAASAAEERRRADGPEPSPLEDVRYAEDAVDLWRWVDAPQDVAVSTFVTAYAGLDPAQRAPVRASLAMDDFYTLLTFARRHVLLALRARDGDEVRAALDALAAIELERVDWRDVWVAGALAWYAARRTGLDPVELATTAAERAEQAVGELLTELAAGPLELAEDCGYREVDTPSGAALFGDEGEPFSPDSDLVACALDLAGVLEDDRYRVSDITVATELPDVWLGGDDNPAIQLALQGLTGSVSVHAELRPDTERDVDAHFMVVFLAEAASAADASAIADAAATWAPRDTAQIGLAAGRRCAVVVARSAAEDAGSVEDPESLERFRAKVARVLA